MKLRMIIKNLANAVIKAKTANPRGLAVFSKLVGVAGLEPAIEGLKTARARRFQKNLANWMAN